MASSVHHCGAKIYMYNSDISVCLVARSIFWFHKASHEVHCCFVKREECISNRRQCEARGRREGDLEEIAVGV